MIALAPDLPRTPWRPRRVESAAQALINRLGRGLVLAGADAELHLSSSAAPARIDAADVLSLRTADGVLHFAGGKSWLRAASGIDPAVVPDEFAEERLWLYRSALERCPAVMQRALGDTEPVAQPCEPNGLTWLEWRLGNAEPALRVGATAPAWLAWLGRLPWTAMAPVALPGEQTLRLQIPVALGWSRLRREQLRQLRTGDFVRLEQAFFNLDGVGRIPVGRNMLGLRWSERNGLGVIEFTSWEMAMTDVQEAEAGVAVDAATHAPVASPAAAAARSGAAPGLGSVDDVPLTVRFEIGTLSLDLSELRRLAPGMALMLDVPSPPPVTLRVNGVAVGTGELVEIDGRMAVQVGSLSVRP